MNEFNSKEEYENYIMSQSFLPMGFKTGVTQINFFPKEKESLKPLPMDLSLIMLDEPTKDFAGVFTKNLFPGHPVVHGKALLEKKETYGVLINNKISNVRCPGGLEDIDRILEVLGQEFNVSSKMIFSSSTGIIGWNLPVNDICSGLKNLPAKMDSKSIYNVSKGIMTTDNYPKIRRVDIDKGSIVAIAKGAGMIEPNMATMLLFVLTDIKIDRDDLRVIFPEIIEKTFNRISIDSDQSTSDTGLIFSSSLVGGVPLKDFKEGLYRVCLDLSQDIVRNGEGTSHVIQVNVLGAKSEADCVSIGKAIVNAPLCKAAIYGNDPNTGRIIQAIGDVCGNFQIDMDPDKIEVSLGGKSIYSNGKFNLSTQVEEYLTDYLKSQGLTEKAVGYPDHFRNVIIDVDLNLGESSGTVYGSDLSYEYVRENGDYRS